MKPNIKLYEDTSPLERLGLQSISYSRINTFDWCETQYFYSYILKYPQKFGAKALLGNVIHKALELTLRDGEFIDKKELLDNYRAAREEYDPSDTIITDELYAEGIEMLDNLVVRQGKVKTQLTEAELAFRFVFEGYLFRGFIDQVIVNEDKVTIVDFKSGAFEVSPKDIPTNLQLGIYSLYMKFIHPDKEITAALYYLRSGRYKSHTYTDEDLITIENNLSKALYKIRENKNYLPLPAHLAWRCKICSYQEDGTCKAGRFNVEKAERKKNKLIKDPGLYE